MDVAHIDGAEMKRWPLMEEGVPVAEKRSMNFSALITATATGASTVAAWVLLTVQALFMCSYGRTSIRLASKCSATTATWLRGSMGYAHISATD